MAGTGEAEWPAGLVELYSAERTNLVRTAFLICGSVPQAEDAVHDALVRVAPRWDGLDRARSYLYVAVVNAARDASRRTRRLRAVTERDAIRDPEQLSVESLALHHALARLPERHRTAVVLRYFADWDDAEIADALGARRATVRSWVHRGLARLRNEMEQ
jgi:RNA polymerase sigma factor (sigma-70 family)